MQEVFEYQEDAHDCSNANDLHAGPDHHGKKQRIFRPSEHVSVDLLPGNAISCLFDLEVAGGNRILFVLIEPTKPYPRLGIALLFPSSLIQKPQRLFIFRQRLPQRQHHQHRQHTQHHQRYTYLRNIYRTCLHPLFLFNCGKIRINSFLECHVRTLYRQRVRILNSLARPELLGMISSKVELLFCTDLSLKPIPVYTVRFD